MSAARKAAGADPAKKPAIKILKSICHPSDDGYFIDAVVEVDGHRVAYHDGGYGGGGEFRAAHPRGRSPTAQEEAAAKRAEAILEAYAATFPETVIEIDGKPALVRGEPVLHRPDAEEILCAELDRADAFKRFERRLRSAVMVYVEGRGVVEYALRQKGRVWPAAQVIEVAKRNHPGCVVLNALPTEEAFAYSEKHEETQP